MIIFFISINIVLVIHKEQMAKLRKDFGKNGLMQNVVLQREVFAEMERLKADIHTKLEELKIKISQNKGA